MRSDIVPTVLGLAIMKEGVDREVLGVGREVRCTKLVSFFSEHIPVAMNVSFYKLPTAWFQIRNTDIMRVFVIRK